MMAAVRVRLFLSGARTVGLCCNRLSNVQRVSGQDGTDQVWLALRQSTGLTLGAIWEPTRSPSTL
ncbi:hypothetical protein VT52_008755 [Streptomyces malaysiense]|uniref:Uncharacterized protein n=1 Tax=Streptomyces malaysiense TaxID=1428626 RepID=A0A1J4Q4Y8_9ACTN|nr:hypothetical protein VT52_008755 [Streptomyces malaysiense]